MPRMRNILVANRGEIAVRVLRAARAHGYRTTAVYSEADARAPHVAMADSAVWLGAAPVAASYLNIARVIEAAKRANADAVHPGYGLLSENAAFAQACTAAGLTFIGPSAATIELMGDKRRARIAMQEAGVPCVPGYDGDDQSDARLIAESARIGFPLMVKAAAGGGGRGLRRAHAPSELPEAIARARSESQNAFGDDRLILERALDGARHVEVQVLADTHGHVLHLGERDCSVQRRFQKIIEQAPSPAVDAELRAHMGAIAVRAAERASYVGAGTVEFLLDAERRCYFLEMNTRLQVEHPVTELVTGIDLVAWQFRVAEGEALSFTQADVQLNGHAIEARVYAEDPDHGFVPATGTLAQLRMPTGDGIRVDHGVAEGMQVSSHYDPMLAKIIAHGRTHEEARRRLLSALAQTRVLGVRNNLSFLRAVLDDARFARGEETTDFIDKHFAYTPSLASMATFAVSALAYMQRDLARASHAQSLATFVKCVGLAWPFELDVDEHRISLTLEALRGGALRARVKGETLVLKLIDAQADALVVDVDGVRARFDHAWDGDSLWLHTPEADFCVRDATYAPHASSAATGSGRAVAPMDGAVVDVQVCVGDHVTRGQTLVVVEAMKLELRVSADVDGVVSALHVARGTQVKARTLLVEINADA